MRLIKAKNLAGVSRKASDLIAGQVRLKPDCVLGLATGSTPVDCYKELIAQCQAGELDFSKVKTVNLDEYVGLTKDHPQSYAYFMRQNLFDHINICPENTYVPNGCAEDLEKEGAEYDARIESFGGIDLQLLGIGLDGHIGFNEPAPIFEFSPTVNEPRTFAPALTITLSPMVGCLLPFSLPVPPRVTP